MFLFFVVPNVFNQREEAHFSKEKYLKLAKSKIGKRDVELPVSDFYDRNGITRWLFGDHYRDIWTLNNEFIAFAGFDTLSFHKVGGGMQTTSIELRTKSKQSYTMRSLDKDQGKVLHGLWKYSAIRSLVRDQTSALNPYNAKVVASLSNTLGIWHTNPELYFVPYEANQDSITNYLAGRMVILEEEPGSKWKQNERFGYPIDIAQTTEVLAQKKKIDAIDTLAYLKCRLFDILISDWDRHEGQWKWVIRETDEGRLAEPFPIDRDMAFGRFDDGLVNYIIVNISNKFKSFRASESSILSGAKKVNTLDIMLLSNLAENDFVNSSQTIVDSLTNSKIENAFSNYPQPVFEKIGDEHIETLITRLLYLEKAAIRFKEAIDESKNTQ